MIEHHNESDTLEDENSQLEKLINEIILKSVHLTEKDRQLLINQIESVIPAFKNIGL